MSARWIARILCTVTLLVAVSRLVLAIADPASSDSASGPKVPGGGVPVAAFEAVVLVMLAVIGAVVASRQPRNAVGWVLCVIPLSLGLLILSAHLYWSLNLHGHPSSTPAELLAWLASWVWIPAMLPTLTVFPLLFPTGRPPNARWRWVLWAAGVAGVLQFVGEGMREGRFQDYPVSNPFSAGAVAAAAGGIGFALMAVATVAAVVSLVLRFRRSHGDQREQIKWVASAAVVFVAIFVVDGAFTEKVVGEDVGFASLLLGILVISSAVAVAMLRYRLYDIDVVINRALVYGSLTATLAAVYIGSVLVLQLVLERLTQGSGLAVAVSTLATAALVRPARTRIQSVVDRRFFRRRYDAAVTLAQFSARVRQEVDLDTLTADFRDVVSHTLQPAHLSLWTPRSSR
ncbi:MAG: hypothetical protein ACJ72E_09130 [Marmoricola sp.]